MVAHVDEGAVHALEWDGIGRVEDRLRGFPGRLVVLAENDVCEVVEHTIDQLLHEVVLVNIMRIEGAAVDACSARDIAYRDGSKFSLRKKLGECCPNAGLGGGTSDSVRHGRPLSAACSSCVDSP